jgi:hypothetical protein
MAAQPPQHHTIAPSLSITSEQERQWREEGYCIVDNFDVRSARAEAVFDKSSLSIDFGSLGGAFEFPCGLHHVDDIPVRLQSVAQKLLRTKAALLSQADVWIKEPKPGNEAMQQYSNDNQRIHCDFGNNTVLPPLDFHQPTAMAAIVYFDGPNECKGGATAVVARRGADDAAFAPENMMIQPGYGKRPFINNRIVAESWFAKNAPEEHAFRASLYNRERRCEPEIGRVLLYRLDIWHRGTPLLAGKRRVMNIVFLNPADPGHAGRWNPGFWKNSYWFVGGRYAPPDVLFSRMTPSQRMMLGFPGPEDSAYWSTERLRLLQLRFPYFDPTPYAAAPSRCTTHDAKQDAATISSRHPSKL